MGKTAYRVLADHEIIRETDRILAGGEHWDSPYVCDFGDSDYVGECVSVFGSLMEVGRAVRLILDRPGYRYLDTGESVRNEDYYLFGDFDFEKIAASGGDPRPRECRIMRRIADDESVRDYEPDAAVHKKPETRFPCAACGVLNRTLHLYTAVSGEIICDRCWNRRTRLERVRRGWEADPYLGTFSPDGEPARIENRADGVTHRVALSASPRFLSSLDVETPPENLPQPFYSIDPEDSI